MKDKPKLIDLTQTIVHHMPTYPGELPTQLLPISDFRKDGFANYLLQIGMHNGTHIDGPMHMSESTDYLSQIPINRFMGNGILCNTIAHNTNELIKQLEHKELSDSIVLIYTGYSQNFGKEGYFENYPAIDMRLLEFLASKSVSIIGVDSPSPDHSPYPAHHLLFAKNILILENLTNLDQLVGANQFKVTALPLKTKTDSSPARVVAHILS
jgi:kynurenine formamidase